MTTTLPTTIRAYVDAVNQHDAAAFLELFADGAIVQDAGREFGGLAAIGEWCEREIVAPLVTLEVIDSAERDGKPVLTTKVDGNFDRTGLPNPVLIDHHFALRGGKIVGLTCLLADQPSAQA